jgi:hypothetical protein
MNSVVVWQWTGPHLGDRPYAPEHVNALQRSIAAHMSTPFRFVCVADTAEGFDPAVEVLITPPEAAALAQLRSPEGGRFPSCYRRLWNFSDGARVLGDRLLCIDIDLVPTADLAPLFDRPEDFVGWRPYRDWGRKLRIGGGIYLLRAGSHPEVWTQFKGEASIKAAGQAGFRGSDQAWLSYQLASRVPHYGREAGIYSIRDLPPSYALPADARLVQMNGSIKPWTSALPWVKEHWRGVICATDTPVKARTRPILHLPPRPVRARTMRPVRGRIRPL